MSASQTCQRWTNVDKYCLGQCDKSNLIALRRGENDEAIVFVGNIVLC